MSKIQTGLAEKYGLIREQTNVYHGKVNGYYTVVQYTNNNSMFVVRMGVSKADSVQSMEPLINQIKQIKLVKSVAEEPHMLVITGKVAMSAKKLLESLTQIFEQTTAYFRAGNFGTGSFLSGIDDGTVKLTQFNDDYFYFSETDYHVKISDLDQNKQAIAETSENVFLGVIGALGGALIGGVLWVIIGRLGYYAWTAGFLAIFLAFHGYRKLGHKVGKVGSVLVFLISLAVIFGASIVEWAWQIYRAVKEVYVVTFLDVLKETPSLLWQDPELKRSFLIDIGIGIGIVVVIGGIMMWQMYRQGSGHYVAQRKD